MTDTFKSCSPRPSSTKTRIKTYNSLDFCYEIVIFETILKKLPGAKNLDLCTKPLAPGNIFYSPSADSCPCRVHKFLFPNTPKNIRMYHPNFHEIIGRVTNFLCPTGIKKGDYIQRIKRCAVIPFTQCDPGGARTLDPLIKSQLLYQLSYGVMHKTGISLPSLRMQRYNLSANRPNIFFKKFFSTDFFARTAKRCRQIAGTADNMCHPFICP